jgi:hypothetical protein
VARRATRAEPSAFQDSFGPAGILAGESLGKGLYYGRACHRLSLGELPMSEVTRILSAIEQGDPHAAA